MIVDDDGYLYTAYGAQSTIRQASFEYPMILYSGSGLVMDEDYYQTLGSISMSLGNLIMHT